MSELGSEYNRGICIDSDAVGYGSSDILVIPSISPPSIRPSNTDIQYYNDNYESFIIEDFTNLNEHIRDGYLVGRYKNRQAILIMQYAVVALEELRSQYPEVTILICNKGNFWDVVEHQVETKNIFLASYLQRFVNPRKSAYVFNRYISRIKMCVIIFAVLCSFYYFEMLPISANLIYFIQNIFKIYVFKVSLKAEINRKNQRCLAKLLPTYTILVPLYREAAKVSSILKSLKKLNYPEDKLDVKLVIERDDRQTLKAIKLQDLPYYIQVIRVPTSHPRTKPKACNYAMQFARGKYTVIYDAEDRPDPNQLLDSVAKFNELSPLYGCLQARLRIMSRRTDLLGHLFKLEYDMLFAHLLTGMAILDLPIPLGGTSNHFKTEVLRELGLWDAYNVTEDADIGIRLNLKGYKVDMLNSTTKEEPAVSLKAWFKQRVRWIKGFIVTFGSYILHDKSKQKFKDKCSVVIFLGFSIINFLVVPIILIDGLFFNGFIGIVKIFIYTNMALFLVFFWSVAYFLEKSQNIDRATITTFLSVILFPAYFLLHSIAAYLAVLEILYSPFRWNKTDHSYIVK